MNRTVVVSVMVAFFTCAALDAQAPHGGQTMPPQPGPNVNAVGGIADPRDPAALVKADLNLQRQNETVVAASARNPDHILAAANDYRFVDFPQDQYYGGAQNFFTRLVARLFGRPGQRLPGRAAAAVGAWTGVYRSCDRGRTWIGSALPGSPLDFSEASMASTLKRLSERAALQGGHAETTDPVLVAGPGGRMHLVVLGFVRFPGGSIGESHMYYASYTDRNNLEGGSCFTYDFMQEIDTGAAYAAATSPTPFIDKPALAVDKDGTLYAAYTVFGDTVKSRIVIARSANGGATWTKTIPLLNLGFLRNHGTSLTIDPVDGTVYVAWRMFYDNWPLMVVSKSYDKGRTFLPATPMSNFWPSRNLQQIIDQLKAAKLQPFDQTSGDPDQPPAAAARAFAFPSIVAGVVNGRSKLFAAWTERADVDPRSTTFGLPSANGSPRIMLTTSSDGGWTWTARRALDAGPRTETLIQPGMGGLVSRPSAPQLQPVLSMSGTSNAQLLVMYYEAREELEAPFATSFISGIERMMDVRAARIDPVTARLLAPSVQVSQYPVKANSSPGALPQIAPGYRVANRQSLTMYSGGTTAFIGDYAGLAPVQPFEFKAGRWDWSADPSPSLAMWTDNRDVAFPMNAQGQPDINGAWTNYQPLVPTDPLAAAATSCAFVASRNSNPYFSEIGGVVAGAPQSFKPLTIQRAFATYVENRTPQDRFFRLTIDDNERQGIDGSFDQFDFGPAGDVRNVKIFANSSHHRTIWVQPRPQPPTASLAMLVQETVTLGGALKTDGYRTRVVLNPDPNNDALTSVPPEATQYAGNPAITSDTSELHNPQISSPQISTFRVSAPQISSPQISTPQISTPQISTPQISTPQISTPQISSPQISTPQISTA